MKEPLMIFFVFSAIFAFGQEIKKVERATAYSSRVWGDDFQGVVFNRKFRWDKSDTSKNQTFTPDICELELAEIFLRRNLDTTKGNYRDSGVPDKLEYYVRQYFGYLDKMGEKIIFINCFYQYSNIYPKKNYWLKQCVFVWDGGPAFWQVKINLDTQKLFDLYINGS